MSACSGKIYENIILETLAEAKCAKMINFSMCGRGQMCKLQCKSNFNRNYVLLLMIENFETNQIVLYLPEGYMIHF